MTQPQMPPGIPPSAWNQPKTPGGDAIDVASEMDNVADEAETTGVDPSEFDDLGWPESERAAHKLAMNHWETGCYHLREGQKAMKAIADRIVEQEKT